MTKITAAAFAVALSLTASGALAATLTDASVTLTNNAPSQPTAITAKHTIVAPLDANEFVLRFQLPNDFTSQIGGNQYDCAGVTLKIDGVTQAFGTPDPCGVTTFGFFYVRTPTALDNGAEVEVQLTSAFYTTPATPGVKTFTMYQTADQSGNQVDGASPMPTVTIAAPPPPAPVPTMTEWAMILLTAGLGGFAALTIHKRRRTV